MRRVPMPSPTRMPLSTPDASAARRYVAWTACGFALAATLVTIATLLHSHRIGAAATRQAALAQAEFIERAGSTRFALYSSDLLAQCVRGQLIAAAGASSAFDTARWAQTAAPAVRKACGQKVAAFLASLPSTPTQNTRQVGIRIAAVSDLNLTEREHPR